MPIVEPHLYRDTPIFQELLEERQGRFPGTPKDEEGPEEEGGAVVPMTPVEPSGGSSAAQQLTPVPLSQRALTPVVPVQPTGEEES